MKTDKVDYIALSVTVVIALLACLLFLSQCTPKPAFGQTPECDLPIPIDLEIRHRGSFEICYYQFLVVYHFSPVLRQSISYYAPKYPKYDTMRLARRGGIIHTPPTVRVWIIPPQDSYKFDVFVRVIGKHYVTAWSEPATMVSDGGK